MIQAYSKRLLSPFTGQVQIVETDLGRARTLDGEGWEIQYKHTFREDSVEVLQLPENSPRHRFVRVAYYHDSTVHRVPLPPYLDQQAVEREIEILSNELHGIELPLPPADKHEFWLLDEEEKPLALIFSCVTSEQIASFPNKLEWTATPSSICKIEDPAEDAQYYVPPVNYRFEQLVKERAGKHPVARWLQRDSAESLDFPPCLVTQDWDEPEAAELCRRYIERLAPRLLMLHGLAPELRQQLESSSRQHAMEVSRYYPLYPEVVDDKTMSAIRVEARLRQASDPQRFS